MQSTELHEGIARNLANPDRFQTEVIEEIDDSGSEKGETRGTDTDEPATPESGLDRKKRALRGLMDLQQEGVKVRSMTLENDVADIESEYNEKVERLNKVDEAQMRISVKTQRRMLLAVVSFVEYAHTKYNPFDVRLSGWGENVMDNIDDYDSVFERLYYKYKHKMDMPPELELLIAILTSAFMFHISKQFMESMAPAAVHAQPAAPNSPMSTASRSSRIVASPLASRITSDDETDDDI